MAKERVILVTGVAGNWGRLAAARLLAGSQAGDVHVIGVDVEAPRYEIRGLDFVRAGVQSALLVELMKAEGVEAVCHLAFNESAHLDDAAFETNVIGTMKVLGACAQAGVKKVVLKSSTAVYGALPDNPAFLPEVRPLQGSRSYGYTRSLVEIEKFCQEFGAMAPEVMLTILRFPGIVGQQVETPLTQYLKGAVVPVLLGFDPMMQVIHEQDVVEALAQAALGAFPGAFNVAAEGVMPLTKLIGLAGRMPAPLAHPLAYLGARVANSIQRLEQFAPIELDYLRYSWVADLGKMRAELAFEPRYTAEEALREFAAQQRLQRYLPKSVPLAEEEARLRELIAQRRLQRENPETAAKRPARTSPKSPSYAQTGEEDRE